MINQKRSKLKGTAPTLDVKDKNDEWKTLHSGKYVRLLGGNVSDNLCWTEHLEMGEKAILPRLRKQLGALNMLSRQLTRSSKLLLANGLLLNKISYTIQLWGAAPKSKLRKVQVIPLLFPGRPILRCLDYTEQGRKVHLREEQTDVHLRAHELLWVASVRRYGHLSLPGVNVEHGAQKHTQTIG